MSTTVVSFSSTSIFSTCQFFYFSFPLRPFAFFDAFNLTASYFLGCFSFHSPPINLLRHNFHGVVVRGSTWFQPASSSAVGVP